jgi:ferrous iron transport protein B
VLDAAVATMAHQLGIPVFALDSRFVSPAQREAILASIATAPVAKVNKASLSALKARLEPPTTWLDKLIFNPLVGAVLLFTPAVIAVMIANNFAAEVDPLVQAFFQPAVDAIASAPSFVHAILAGRYGLLSMGPLMLVWAMPTVLLYAILLGIYKASGLLDRLTVAIHPLLRPFGLSGRDAVRVLMGFGCNVPAVLSTRACSSCSRDTCVSAISFGSACSYQLGATLAVFASTKNDYLIIPYMIYLMATTLIFVRLISKPVARSTANEFASGRAFIQWPTALAVWRECRMTIVSFLRKAMPIFILITMLASALDWAGIVDAAGRTFGRLMIAFTLPPDTLVPVLMASIRKDGVLLLGAPELVAQLSPGQILVSVYLAGVLVPCLVTFITVAQERSLRFAAFMIVRQASAALIFAAALAWTVHLAGL